MAQVGLKDVARVAGVSYKTVSRVVNGEATVSGETRRRVEEAVAQLGYRPNLSARSLRRGRTQTLQLIMCVGEMHVRHERFQDEVVAAVIDRATASGYSVLLELARKTAGPALLARYGDRRSDGTILLDSTIGTAIAPVLRRAGQPAVALVNPEADPSFGSIDADFDGGALAAVRHLLDLGHRRIAHLADNPNLHSSIARRRGYERALRAAGVAVDEELIVLAGSLRHHGYAATAALLARRPDVTALFCVNDLTAFGAIECLQQRGRRVPDDVSVTGYDDIEVAKFAVPPLTTVHIPWWEMAELAADRLIAAIEGDGDLPFQQRFPVELQVRGTTGPAPAS